MRRKNPEILVVLAVLLLALISTVLPVSAQNEVLHSEVLDEDRILEIRLPQSYEDSEGRYPVLYILDAEYRPRFDAAVVTVALAAAEGTSPEMIVIGILNKNRNRDMIPVAVERKPGSGGSGNFLRFIAEELMPFVDERYRTDSTNLLYGGSNAGLFAVYAILERPNIFSAAIAGSPMFGHCSDFMHGVADNLDDFEQYDGRYLYMIFGDDDYEGCTDYVTGYFAYIRNKDTPGFHVELVEVRGGGHVPDEGMARGLEYVFSRPR